MDMTRVGLALCCVTILVATGCGDDESGGTGGSGAASSGGSSSGGASSGGSGMGGSAAGGGGMVSDGPCATTACNEMSPDAACETCIEDECSAETAACLADTTDPTANCIGCADVLGAGDFDDGCPAAKTLFVDFLECICGDGTTAGKCN